MITLRQMFLFVFAVGLGAQVPKQTPNQQILNDQSIVEITHNGIKVSFSIGEAKMLYRSLWAQMDPLLPVNSYMPQALKDKLNWVRNSAYTVEMPTFPDGWNQNLINSPAATMADANYCKFPQFPDQKPCIRVYPNMLMILMRYEFMMLKPNQGFKNTFAIFLAHEAIHHERGATFFRPQIPPAEVAAEELRAWIKTIKDIVRPLRRIKQPMYNEFETMDDMLTKCKDRLPCKPFEAYIQQYKVSKR